MFRKAKKLNMFAKPLFIVALFGFFACTMHIFPTHNNESAETNSMAHHDNAQRESQCLDHNTTLANSSKNNDLLVDEALIDTSFYNFTEIISLQKVGCKNFENLSLKHKVPIFIENSILLI